MAGTDDEGRGKAGGKLAYPPDTLAGPYDDRPAGDRVRRDREYVATTVGYAGVSIPQALSPGFDALTRRFGRRVYESMLVDPVVSSCFDILRLGVLSNGLTLTAAVPAEDGAAPDARQAKSAEVAEFCGRVLRSLETPIESVLYTMLEAMAYGCQLAEKVYDVAPRGPDAGRVVLRRIKPKPKESWHFLVDAAGEVVGYWGRSVLDGAQRVYPAEKFFTYTCDPVDGDPRGRSILRPAYDPWDFKIKLWSQFWAAAEQFGSPSLVVEVGEDAIEQYPEDENGQPIEGAEPLSPQAAAAKAAEKFRASGILAVPNGTKVTIAAPNYDGAFFDRAFALVDKQIAHAILKAARGTQESKHGSRADSETAQDYTALAIARRQQDLAAQFRRQVLWHLVAINEGEDVADEHTPTVSFGATEKQDFAPVATAVASLMSAGYLDPSQLMALDQWLGIKVRTSLPEADDTDQGEGDDDDDRKLI